jgi:hypothetical protein
MHQNALAPTADNGLINGTMVSTFGGSYSRTTLTPGRKHRLRIINTAVDGHFQFSLDGHTMTVIAADFVPIVPYNASWVFVGIGQRYDVIIDANQTPGSYWFRAQSQDVAGCGSNFQNGNIRAIFAYQGHEDETPSTIAAPNTQRCTDETNIVPHWNSYVPPANIPEFEQLDAAINQSTAADGTLTIYWQVNSTPLRVDWGNPTVSAIQENPAHSNWPRTAGVITLPDANRWTYWVITEGVGSPFTVNIPHPIHMHGHDFSVLGWGTSAWTDADRENLNYRNPPRRDVAMLPTNGWVAIAFETNNPGAWLMHCHIVSESIGGRLLNAILLTSCLRHGTLTKGSRFNLSSRKRKCSRSILSRKTLTVNVRPGRIIFLLVLLTHRRTRVFERVLVVWEDRPQFPTPFAGMLLMCNVNNVRKRKEWEK